MNHIETMNLALDALEELMPTGSATMHLRENAIAALHQAIEQAEKQEPVAYIDAIERNIVYVSPQRKRWLSKREDKEWRRFHYDHQYDTPLYTAPPKREWVGLTDEEIEKMFLNNVACDDFAIYAYVARTIQSKLKEKNHVD